MAELEKYSYSAANVFPLKAVTNLNILVSIKYDRVIPPIHPQLNPTNKCNFSCPFCSCSDRDKQKELNIKQIERLIDKYRALGAEAWTVTGGGEPTIHRDFDKIIKKIFYNNMESGLVTNGTVLDRCNSLNRITWIRISASDILERELEKIGSNIEDHLNKLDFTVNEYPMVDWAFSYVLGDYPNHKLIQKLVEFANSHDFTHVRIVNDILKVGHLNPQMDEAKKTLRLNGVDDSKVNYQERSHWTQGTEKCYISLLKPVIGADGYIYPCCGTQYALKDPSRDYEKAMRMGHISNDIERISKEQAPFDGSICWKCYYSEYNQALGILLNGLKHKAFV